MLMVVMVMAVIMHMLAMWMTVVTVIMYMLAMRVAVVTVYICSSVQVMGMLCLEIMLAAMVIMAVTAMHVVMAIVLMAAMLMVMAAVLMVFMHMIMAAVLMIVVAVLVSIQIRHVMVMVLVLRIQAHVKVAYIQPGLFHPADLGREPLYRKALQSLFQHLLIGPQIQKSRHRHISADPGIAFQV